MDLRGLFENPVVWQIIFADVEQIDGRLRRHEHLRRRGRGRQSFRRRAPARPDPVGGQQADRAAGGPAGRAPPDPHDPAPGADRRGPRLLRPLPPDPGRRGRGRAGHRPHPRDAAGPVARQRADGVRPRLRRPAAAPLPRALSRDRARHAALGAGRRHRRGQRRPGDPYRRAARVEPDRPAHSAVAPRHRGRAVLLGQGRPAPAAARPLRPRLPDPGPGRRCGDLAPAGARRARPRGAGHRADPLQQHGAAAGGGARRRRRDQRHVVGRRRGLARWAPGRGAARPATPPAPAVSLVWPPGRHLSPKVRVFVDFLVAAFAPPPWDDRPAAGGSAA